MRVGARGAGCGGTECGGWGAGCDAPLDHLSDLGAAQLVDDGVDLVDELASAEAREVAELGGREGPCARERRALGRGRREGGGWFGVCSPFSHIFSSADVILPGSAEGLPSLVVTRSSCGCPDTFLWNVSISCVLQGKRHVRVAGIVWRGWCGETAAGAPLAGVSSPQEGRVRSWQALPCACHQTCRPAGT